jgi:hypothetical protein
VNEKKWITRLIQCETWRTIWKTQQLPSWFDVSCNAHQQKQKKTLNLSCEITPMWCPWNTKFSSKPRHAHLKSKSSSKIPPYLDCNNIFYSSIHFHMFQVPRLVRLVIFHDIHIDTNPLLVVHYISDFICSH